MTTTLERPREPAPGPAPRTRVSVVVPTRDRPEFLKQALASIRALEGDDLEFEILVGDNGMRSENRDVAEQFGARWLPVERAGAAAARNAAMRAATSDYIAFLDDDDVWLAGHIRPHVRLLEEHPELQGVVGQVANAAPDLSSHGPFWPEALPVDGRVFSAFLRQYPQIGATVVRASVRESVGYFDEELIADQDWDWHLRLATQHRVGFVATPCVLFRQRAAGAHDTLQWQRVRYYRRVFWRNVRRAGAQRPPLPQLGRIFLGHSGAYEHYFAESARAQLQSGNRKESALALTRAFRASPPHAALDLFRASDLRWSLGHLLLPKSRLQRRES